MAEGRDDTFRVKPRPPKGASRARDQSFLSRVVMEMTKAGGRHSGRLGATRSRGAKRGRGGSPRG